MILFAEFFKYFLICIIITGYGAKIAAVIVVLLPKGVKCSKEFKVSDVNRFPNNPLFDIAITVLSI
jgi:hypothetical protein